MDELNSLEYLLDEDLQDDEPVQTILNIKPEDFGIKKPKLNETFESSIQEKLAPKSKPVKAPEYFEIPDHDFGVNDDLDWAFISKLKSIERKLTYTRARRKYLEWCKKLLIAENAELKQHLERRNRVALASDESKPAQLKPEHFQQELKEESDEIPRAPILSSYLPDLNNNADNANKDEFEEKWSRIRLKNRLTSQSFLDEKILKHKFIPLNQIERHIQGGSIIGEWCTIAILTKFDVKQSKGGPYGHVTLSLLDEFNRFLFAFGKALETCRTFPVGTTLALFSAKISKSSEQHAINALTVDDGNKIVNLGLSMDIARCKGSNKDGRKCDSIVDIRGCGFCKYHVVAAQKKLQNNRPYMMSKSTAIPVSQNSSKPQGGVYFVGKVPINTSDLPKVNKTKPSVKQVAEDETIVNDYMKTASMGTKYANVMEGREDRFETDQLKRLSAKPNQVNINSKVGFREAIKNGKENIKGQVMFSDSEDEDVRVKKHDPIQNITMDQAILIKKQKNIVFEEHDHNMPFSKRPRVTKDDLDERKRLAKAAKDKRLYRENLEEIMYPTKNTNLNSSSIESMARERTKALALKFGLNIDSDDFKRKVQMKSGFASELNQQEYIQILDYLKLEEFKENVAEKAENITSIKVSAHYCFQCDNYTSSTPPSCIENGHRVEKRSNVSKSVYMCSACKFKIFALGGRLPKGNCRKCGSNNILPFKMTNVNQQASIPDSMKVLPRGVEHSKFIN